MHNIHLINGIYYRKFGLHKICTLFEVICYERNGNNFFNILSIWNKIHKICAKVFHNIFNSLDFVCARALIECPNIKGNDFEMYKVKLFLEKLDFVFHFL